MKPQYVKALLDHLKDSISKGQPTSVTEQDILSYVEQLEKITVEFAIRICDIQID